MVNFGINPKAKKPQREEDPTPPEQIDERKKVFRFDDNLKLKIIDARPHRWMIWDILIVLHLIIITWTLVLKSFTPPTIQIVCPYHEPGVTTQQIREANYAREYRTENTPVSRVPLSKR